MIDCRVCLKPRLIPISYLFGPKSNSNIPLFKCPSCDSYFTLPPKYQHTVKPEFQWEGGVEYFLQRKEATLKTVESMLMSLVGPHGGCRKKYLDIGCAIGFSLIVAQRFGFEAYGIEPEFYEAQYARNTLQLNVENTTFHSELFEDNSFDFIMLNQVLEHVLHPKTFLGDAIKILKPGGILFISVPPIDWLRLLISNITKSKIRKFDLFYDPDEHVNYFFRKGIKQLVLDNNGLFDGIYHPNKIRVSIYRLFNLTSGAYIIRKPPND